LPAVYRYYAAPGKRVVGNPADDIPAFLGTQLSLGGLADMLKHLWLAGAERPATPLHFHVALGRQIAIVDRMDLHLLWYNKGRLFVKSVPRFLLDPTFCSSNLQCPDGCACDDPPTDTWCRGIERKVALGFLYTYVCLISSETDFHIANETRLLPRNQDDSPIKWTDWKAFARELVEMHDRNPDMVHPRFLRAELRLSRIDAIHRLTRLPPFRPYIRGWRSYSTLFRDNLAWMATAAVFLALVLTAMQVGLATQRLQNNITFQQASYGFTVFAILGPICAFGLVVLGALFNLVIDLPAAVFGRRRNRAARGTWGQVSQPTP